MVKVGKFDKREISIMPSKRVGLNVQTIPYGVNLPAKKIWFGIISKNTAANATMNFNARAPTWGFSWIDYCEIHTRCHAGPSMLGQAGGTVAIFYNHNPTMYIPITIAVANRCFMFIIGRDNQGRV